MPLNKPQLIQINEVKAQVESSLKQHFTWFYTQDTGSTNSDLLQHRHPQCIAITENQSQGRGQRNNLWQSNAAENLLFSVSISTSPSCNLALIPIKVGIALKNTLNEHGFDDVSLKWPNDIFYHNKKVGGILIESMTQNDSVLLVIGVGLNINMPYTDDDPFIALKHDQLINRTPLLISSIKTIFECISNNEQKTVDAFNTAHLFHNTMIKFKNGDKISTGLCQGINQHGQLMIDTQRGLETHSTGSIMMDQHVIT